MAAVDARRDRLSDPKVINKGRLSVRASFGAPKELKTESEIGKRIEAGDLKAHTDDPNLEPKDEIDTLLKEFAAAALADPSKTIQTKRTFYDGVSQGSGAYTVRLEVRPPYLGSTGGATTHPDIEMDPAGVEKSMREVGKLGTARRKAMMADVEAKIATDKAEHLAWRTKFKKEFGLSDNVKWGRPTQMADGGMHVGIWSGGGEDKVPHAVQLKMKDALIARHNSGPFAGGDYSTEARNMRTKASKDAFRTLMGEMTAVGGKVDGTPGHKKPKVKTKMSTNEQIVAVTDHLPTAWIDASNRRGKVAFRVGKGRAYYQDSGGKMKLDGSTSTAMHEMQHRFEYSVPGYRTLEKEFWERRTKGGKMKWLGPGHSKSEKAIEDDFFSAYVGKDYGGNAYEVASMGFEYLFGGNSDKVDADYEDFLWGLVALTG